MAEKSLSVREIVGEFTALGGAHAAFLAGVTALIAVGYVLLDLVAASGSAVAGIVVGVFVQYIVLERLLADSMAATGKAPKRRYGAMFLSSIVGGLGILLGLALLIVPGLFLMAGWSASSAFIVAEEKGGVEALGESWRATERSRWALTLVVAIGFIAFVALIAAVIAASGFLAVAGASGAAIGADGSTLVELIPANIAASAMSVASWLLGAAVYRLVRPMGQQLDEVFA